MRAQTVTLTLSIFVAAGTIAAAQENAAEAPPTAACCAHPDLADQYGIIWTGRDREMTIEERPAHASTR